jgi:site-specific DNA recombinase
MRRQSDAHESTLRRVRCAIYTRKSTEENLDSEFNSLDAQREAAEAYITSQRHEGWVALSARYDDGGFSGGNMERPGLQRLLEDVEAGRVDSVVVYKVDRLSRSLLDFARIIETFDRKGVSFVSVTQQFNTTSSMGRLTLNILLSFAQFEREIIGERIRDKIASTRRKGKYAGGRPVLGYGVDRANHRLVVNQEEAKLVRHIFNGFLKLGSATELAKELNAGGHRTKSWPTQKGIVLGGRPWNKSHLYRLLNNPLYVGEVTHKENRYPGEHEAIISRQVWERVHAILAKNCRTRANHTRAKTHALLRGIIRCAHCDAAMIPTFSENKGKRYRYYLCGRASKQGHDACPTRTVAAGEIEGVVVEQLRGVFRSPEMIAKTYRSARAQAEERREALRLERERAEEELKALREHIARAATTDGASGAGRLTAAGLAELQTSLAEQEDRLGRVCDELGGLERLAFDEQQVAQALASLDPIWEQLFPQEQARIVQLLVERVEIHPDRAEVRIRADGLASLVAELGAEESTGQEAA